MAFGPPKLKRIWTKIAVHTARDWDFMGPWTYRGAALPRGSAISLRGNQDLWALGISFLDTHMETGTWTDAGAVVTSTPQSRYNAIDGNLVSTASGGVNGSGPSYSVVFGGFWDGIFAAPVDLSFDSSDRARDGGFVFPAAGGQCFLFFSQGSCCGYDRKRPSRGNEYRIMVRQSAAATGGSVDKADKPCASGGGSVVLESHGWVYGPDGQGVYQDPTYRPVLYYHYVDTRVGYADGQKRFG
ncbi:glycosyl hydrolase [Lasiosphaeria ovina]|uniref:Glycosyl hydrolase n=1 Tax=Lasiosphaeria ovina TaxID=92902 RepID=A0AAE0NC82_9PEZI|nr:glycosyl hydrolase [Lasiosphaeria ovina]